MATVMGEVPRFDSYTARMGYELSGEIDIAVRDRARSELLDRLEGSEGEFAIDLRAVTFMDSAGLAVLADVAKAARAAGRSVRLVAEALERVMAALAT